MKKFHVCFSVTTDLIVEFILSHLMKKFPHELYELSLGVVLRVLCHQKRSRLRLALCPWKELWAALIALLKFLHGSDSALVRKFDLFALATQAVNILNLFITFGDTFLPSPQSYDDLYYEIIRMHHVFDNLHAMALRYSTGDNEFRESAVRLSAALINVRAIGQHFKPKIELWMESQKLSTPTQDQVTPGSIFSFKFLHIDYCCISADSRRGPITLRFADAKAARKSRRV
jgi:Domain of unknown function (DUF1741)